MALDRHYLPRTDFASEADYLENFRLDIPADFNYARDVVHRYAREEPSRRALVWVNDHGERLELSFGQLAARANQVAHALRSLGVGPGDPVLLCLKGRWHFWPCLVALCQLGAIIVPATHMLQPADLEYRFKRLPFRAVIAAHERDLMSHLRAVIARQGRPVPFLSVDGAEDGCADFNELVDRQPTAWDEPVATRGADTMLIYFTSGTTGMPKMVPHDHRYPVAHLVTARYWQHCGDDSLHYTVADTGWAKFAWGKVYGQWLSGAAIFAYDYDAFNAGRMMAAINANGVTSFCAPATIYRLMVKEGLEKLRLPTLRHCCVAGEPLNPEIYNLWLERTGLPIYEGFGQTETVALLANWGFGPVRPGSMGKPAPIYDVVLLDPDDRPCDVGAVGEISVRVPEPGSPDRPAGLFPGYRDDEPATRAAWHDGFYRTGDLAWRDEDGYYWFVGRADDLIKSSGYKVGPFEVENALMSHPAVLECAVTGVPDPVRGQAVKATIMLTLPYRGRDAAGLEELVKEIQDHVKKTTEPYKYPRVVEFVAELPKTASGKIRRTALRARDQASGGNAAP